MLTVLLVIHSFACVAMVGAVLIQRSEGGALGIGGGGGGGLISGRGAADVLVRTTMVLGAIFFTTSLILTRMSNDAATRPSEIERVLNERSTDVFTTPGKTDAPAPAAPVPVIDPLSPSTTAAPAPATTPAPASVTAPPAATAPAQSTTPAPAAPPAETPAPGPASPN